MDWATSAWLVFSLLCVGGRVVVRACLTGI